jgi:hypothetical protein
MALAAVLLGIFAAAYEIVKERPIYWRERMVSLRLLPYLMSKVVVLGSFSLVQCLLLLLAVGLKVKMPSEGVIFAAPVEMYVTLVLGTLTAILMGLLVSAFVPNTDTVIYLVLLVLFFQIIFAGVIFDLPDTAGKLSNLTLSRWVMEGLGTSVNMPKLNEKTRTRFQPDPVTEEISVDVERPDPDWEPVTVITKVQSIEGCAGPIPLPEVTKNEMVTVTERVTETRTFSLAEQDVSSKQDFQINYAHTAAHLCWTWLVLLGFALAFGTGTILALKQQDVG